MKKNDFFDLKIFIFHTIFNEKISEIFESLDLENFRDRFSFWPNFFSNKAIIDRLKVLTSLDVPLSIPRRFRASKPWQHHDIAMTTFFLMSRQISIPGLWGGPRAPKAIQNGGFWAYASSKCLEKLENLHFILLLNSGMVFELNSVTQHTNKI